MQLLVKVLGILALSFVISLAAVWAYGLGTLPSLSSEDEICQALGASYFMFLGHCLSVTIVIMTWALVSLLLSTIVVLLPARGR